MPPVRQVSYLAGVNGELLSIALDPLPPTAPAVVQFRPATGGQLGDQVDVLLDELDAAAVALFPSWLPGAERIAGPEGLGVDAVRALAAETAARSRNFGPFLADLAERALRGRAGEPVRRGGGRRRFPAEVRAAGLVRVVADAYHRQTAALLIDVPGGLSPADESSLTAAAEWLAHHGRLTVWLVGAPLHVVDRVPSVAITLPSYLTQLAREVTAAGRTELGGHRSATFTYPPLSGLPRADSAAERALERALERYEWASGRRWNYTFEWHLLHKPYRLDLFWAAEGLVVEVDGSDHLRPLKFADDRYRDVQLQLLGHDVLRFTNEQVLSDVQAVVRQIGQLLSKRRTMNAAPDMETRHRVDH